jgi:LEA14-like dessication related protein
MRQIVRVAPLGAFVTWLTAAGCAGLPRTFEDPDVQLSGVVVRGLGLTGGTLDLVVNVRNPNNFALRGTRLEAGFDVEDKHVGDVTFDNAFNIPQNGTTAITLPVRFDWAGVGAAFRSALGYGDIPYTLKGQATLQIGGGKASVPFTRKGRAPLSRVSFSPGVGRSADAAPRSP